MKRNIFTSALLLALLGFSACSIKKEPYDGKASDVVLKDPSNLQSATLGNYALLKDGDYVRNYHIMIEYASDNVSLSGTTTDPLFYSYNYAHLANQANTNAFWRKAYQLINGVNQVLEAMPTGSTPAQQQLLGENYYLRAMAYFDLVNIFGRPYIQGAETNLGVPLVLKPSITDLPARNTVKEVYTQVISDLRTAYSLMGDDKGSSYASKNAAAALMARVYLFKRQNDSAYYFANEVITSGNYSLVATKDLPGYFTMSNEDNPETIFAIHHTLKDDQDWGSIGSMYYTSPGGLGYGEMYASRAIRDLYAQYPADVRARFIQPSLADDGTVNTRNGYPKYFILKYSNQDGIVTLSSPVYLRLGDMYLVRAEASAKLGNNAAAIGDVNTIRQRAGLTGTALYSGTDLKGHASVLDVVLEERHLELAFECSRKLDLFRNNLDLVRNYPGTHVAGGPTGSGYQLIKASDPRVVHFIPENETILNKNLVQNP